MHETYYKNLTIQKEGITADICHDFYNRRIRVDDYRGNIKHLLAMLSETADERIFEKIIIKSRKEHMPDFLSAGYVPEAVFSNYFNGSHAIAMCKFLSETRRNSSVWREEDLLLDKVTRLALKTDVPNIPEGYQMRLAGTNDCRQLSQLYGLVFQVYPTPMNDPSYIKKMMDEGTLFFVIEASSQIVAAASADIHAFYNNAELTDCATLPEHRKYGLMKILIQELEKELKKRHIFCAYSIARALSFGMNAVFFQRGYSYKGRMANNCMIFDKYEDMNVWVKDLSMVNAEIPAVID